jgi:hypothetical protein
MDGPERGLGRDGPGSGRTTRREKKAPGSGGSGPEVRQDQVRPRFCGSADAGWSRAAECVYPPPFLHRASPSARGSGF